MKALQDGRLAVFALCPGSLVAFVPIPHTDTKVPVAANVHIGVQVRQRRKGVRPSSRGLARRCIGLMIAGSRKYCVFPAISPARHDCHGGILSPRFFAHVDEFVHVAGCPGREQNIAPN